MISRFVRRKLKGKSVTETVTVAVEQNQFVARVQHSVGASAGLQALD
jgi:hypothetical protein